MSKSPHRAVGIVAMVTATVLALAASALAVAPSSPESEPNGTAATATPIATAGTCYGFRTAAIDPIAEVDFFSFPGAVGDLVWSNIDTGGTQLGGATSRDSRLDLIAPDGTTVIENDDDDGTGNGGDGTTETGLSSLIGGRALTAAGTHFLRVRQFTDTQLINPYRAFAAVTSAAPVNEVEPNDISSAANPVVDCRTPINGTISPAGDADNFKVDLQAGQTVFVDADGDPERNGSTTDNIVELRSPADGLLLSADSNPGASPGAEGYDFDIPADGTYTIRVRAFAAATGTYRVLVAANDIVPPKTTITSPPPEQTNDNTPTVAFSQVDAVSPSPQVKTECSTAPAGAAFTFRLCSGPGTDTAPTPLEDGAWSYLVRGTDASGNVEGSVAQANFTVDTVDPVLNKVKVEVKDDTAKLKFDASDDATGVTLRCKVDKGGFKDCTKGSKRKFKKLDDGRHKTTVLATDGAGNETTVAKKFRTG